MTKPPETAAPARDAPGPAPTTPEERPALRVVTSDENQPAEPAAAEAEQPGGAEPTSADPASAEDEIAPDAPWQYRLGQAVAEAADALPGVWSNRPASFAEQVDYSLNGDWTTAEPGQSGKRALHLIATIPPLFVDGLIVTPLRLCCKKPSRFYLLLVALLILGYAL